jgi:hypothetical protein
MTRQNLVGWLKSVLILVAGCLGIYAWKLPTTHERVAWIGLGLAFCLGVLRAIDLISRKTMNAPQTNVDAKR